MLPSSAPSLAAPEPTPITIDHGPARSVTGPHAPTCRVHYDSLPYNYGFFRPLQTSHHMFPASILDPMTSCMHTRCLNHYNEHCITGTGDSYWRSPCQMTAQLPHDTMEGGTVSAMPGDINPRPPVLWQSASVINMIEIHYLASTINKVNITGFNTKPMQIHVYT